jgi:hypothetical protein
MTVVIFVLPSATQQMPTKQNKSNKQKGKQSYDQVTLFSSFSSMHSSYDEEQ